MSNTHIKPQTLIGADTFSRLVERSTVIVDKTLLIKEFLENSNNVNLITYPRRWGKTINMDMLKTFLELEVDEHGQELPEEQKCNNRIFAEGKWQDAQKVPMNIWQEQQLVEQYFGKYPVISLTFKDIRGASYEEIKIKTVGQIRKLYKQHTYLLNSKLLADDDKNDIEKYIYGDLNADLENSLKNLSEYLSKHFKKLVFILIDEYDTPINHANLEFKDASERKKVVELFRGILGGALKGNNYMERGLVTGILRIARADLFSGVNNFQEYNILDREYAPYYGFTKLEVEELLNKYNVTKDLQEAMKSWYNGYKAGSFEIYNPWSILKCLTKIQKYTDEVDVDVKTEILRSYWEESGSVNFISELLKEPEIKSIVTDLIEGEAVYFNLTTQITIEDFNVLRVLTTAPDDNEIKEPAIDLLFSYLFLTGYLTPVSYSKEFRLPNNEIRHELSRKLLVYYEELYNVSPRLFNVVSRNLQAVLSSNREEEITELMNIFISSLQELMDKFPAFAQIIEQDISSSGSNQQQVVHGNEDVIHGVLTYIILQVRTASILGSEMYLGKGRADLVLIDNTNNKCAIMELKYNKTSEEAIEQIKEQEYAKDLQKKYETFLIGINILPDKKVEVKYEVVSRIM